MNRDVIEKAVPVLSLVILTFLYGYAAAALGWFPSGLVRAAVRQGDRILNGPHYLSGRVYDRYGVRVPAPEEVQPGLTLVSTIWSEFEDRAGLKLIDAQGTVLHGWPADPTTLFKADEQAGSWDASVDIHGSYLFPNGDVLVNIEYVGSARIDACGNVVWTMRRGNHHSVARADDGSFWIPGTERVEEPGNAARAQRHPGLTFPVQDDRLLHVSEDGELLDVISVIDLLYSNDLEHYLPKTSQAPGGEEPYPDLIHLNDIEPLSESMAAEYPLFEAGDLVISLLRPNLVMVLDPTSRAVKWYASGPFIRQHDPDFIGGGWIGVFDNNYDWTARGTMLGGSRIVALQPHTDSVRVLFPTPASEPFYTAARGKWQLLDNGNMLLTESLAGRIVEVAPDGRTVWEWIREPFDERRTVQVAEGTRYSYPVEHVRSWACDAPRPTQEAEAP